MRKGACPLYAADRRDAVNALAAIQVRQKQDAKATTLLTELGARSTQRNAYDMAVLYLDMNDVDQGLFWLERACEERAPGMAFLGIAQKGRRFSTVRKDPRFDRILQCAETAGM